MLAGRRYVTSPGVGRFTLQKPHLPSLKLTFMIGRLLPFLFGALCLSQLLLLLVLGSVNPPTPKKRWTETCMFLYVCTFQVFLKRWSVSFRGLKSSPNLSKSTRPFPPPNPTSPLRRFRHRRRRQRCRLVRCCLHLGVARGSFRGWIL